MSPSRVSEQARGAPACPRHHMTALSFQRPHGHQVLVWRSDRPGLNSCSHLMGLTEVTEHFQVAVHSFLEEEQSPPQILVMKIKGTVSQAKPRCHFPSLLSPVLLPSWPPRARCCHGPVHDLLSGARATPTLARGPGTEEVLSTALMVGGNLFTCTGPQHQSVGTFSGLGCGLAKEVTDAGL